MALHVSAEGSLAAFSPHLGEVARAFLVRVTELWGVAFLAKESIIFYGSLAAQARSTSKRRGAASMYLPSQACAG